MISMKQKQKIVIGYYLEGKSCLAISRETGLNWRTVSRYIQAYKKLQERALEQGLISDGGVLLPDAADAPFYDSSGRVRRKLTDAVIAEIEKCLEENRSKVLKGQHKQCMKRIDVYEHLRGLGYDTGYTTVATFISDLEKRRKETFVRQEYQPGEVCEFDWGTVKLIIKGVLRVCYMAVFASAYSNYRFAVLFERAGRLSFERAHVLFFAHTGGSFKEMVYDNMKVAVKSFAGNEKTPTESLLKLSMYYLFRYRFCNVRRGNEKGHVEKSVEYIRRKAFCRSGSDVFETLEEANAYLLGVCNELNRVPQKIANGKTGVEMFADEKPYLNGPAAPYDCSELAQKRVDKYGTVSVYQNMYSVPEEYTGQIIDVRIYPEKIVCYGRGIKICEHIRTYGSHEWNINIEHYLKTFLKKPGALAGSSALRNSAEFKEICENHFKGSEKDFIELLLYRKTRGRNVSEITDAIEEILRSGSLSVSTDKIKCICEREDTPLQTGTLSSEISRVSEKQLSEHSALMADGGEA